MKVLLEELIVAIIALSIAIIVLCITFIIIWLYLPIKLLERLGIWIQKITTS